MIIGILGRKGAGKDTIADHMIKNYKFQKLVLAQPLKDACKVLFNFNDEQLYGNLKETIDPNWGVSPRQVLQYVGTDIFRKDITRIIPDINSNFWVNLMSTKYKQMKENDPNIRVVVSDVRFENEINEIHKLNGIIIKVTRPGMSNNDMHDSERLIDNLHGDYEIQNDSGIEELYNKINNILDENVFKKS
jgi:hypothetical protein